MSVEDNKAILKRIFDEIWNKGNLDLIPELISPEYVGHSPQGENRGIEDYREGISTTRAAFPDLHMSIDFIIGEDDYLASQVTMTGTHQGEYMGIPATGKKVTYKHALFTHIKNGTSVEATPFGNALSFYQQLGVSPPTA
jgi:steroid delta-isomerase-like uncharacterized protein